MEVIHSDIWGAEKLRLYPRNLIQLILAKENVVNIVHQGESKVVQNRRTGPKAEQ